MRISEGYAQRSIETQVSKLFRINLTPHQHQFLEARANHNVQENNNSRQKLHSSHSATEILAVFSFSTQDYVKDLFPLSAGSSSACQAMTLRLRESERFRLFATQFRDLPFCILRS